jgi:hypothetical protein
MLPIISHQADRRSQLEREQMKHIKFKSRIFRSAAVVAVGLVAASIAIAQAALPGDSTAGEFKVLGNSFTATLLVTFKGEQDGDFTVFLIPNAGIEIYCGAGITEEGKLLSSNEGLVKFLYGACDVYEHNGAAKVPCEIIPNKQFGLKAKFLPILHGGKLFVLFEPDGGSTFGDVTFKNNGLCPLELLYSISGSFSAEVESGEKVVRLLELTEKIQKLTGDVAKFGAYEMFFKFPSGWIFELTGLHLDCQWGIV